MQVQSSKTCGNRNLVSGFLRLFVLSLLMAVFAFTSLHAQVVAYVVNADGTVSVVDTSTNTITATIAIGALPGGVSFSPDGTRAYVANRGDSSISVIDTASNTVVATVALAPDSFPLYPAVTPDGKFLYVAEVFSGNVEVVSAAANSVVASIPVGGFPCSVAITPDGAHGYVSNGIDFVSVIDIATNTISVGSIPVTSDGNCAFQFAVTPAGDAVYVPGINRNVVSVISTATNTVSATVAVPPPGAIVLLTNLVITPDGSRAYVQDAFHNQVDVIDTATNTLEPIPIPVGSVPTGVAVTPDGSLVYVANVGDNTLSVISTATNTVVATIADPDFPFKIAIANLSVPFASFPAPTPSSPANPNKINLSGSLSLGANSPGLDFAHKPMTLTVGGFSLLFPAGTVTQVGISSQQHFTFSGTLNGLSVTFDLIGNSPNFSYSVTIQGKNVATQVGPNPVTVTLAIGSNSGSSTVNF